jgi:hypothetical protein
MFTRALFGIGAAVATIGTLVACGGSSASGSGSSDGVGGSSDGAGGGSSTAATGGSSSSSTGGGSSITPCNSSANIVGSWELADDGSQGVIGIYTFASSGAFTVALFASAGAGAFDEEEETGTYTVSGSVLTLNIIQSTCPAAAPPVVLACGKASGDLILQVPGETEGLWVPGKAPTGDMTTGCDVNGVWEPFPLMNE